PEWYLVIALLTTLALLGVAWTPLLMAVPLLACAAGLSLLQAAVSAANASSSSASKGTSHFKVMGITMILHLMQPLARLFGRFKYGLHPWRHRGAPPQLVPRPKTVSIWSEAWQTPEEWLRHLQSRLRSEGNIGFAGGGYDDWD